MAQNVTVAGASYSDVPSVTLPKTGGGTASFTDVTGTTALAADVASGKYFFTASGVLTLGTASSGGGAVTQDQDGYLVLSDQGGGGGATTLKMGVIRPDAELVQSWTYDKWAVDDLELTIPAYTTTDTTLVASSDLSPTVTLSMSEYDYYALIRGLTYPAYVTGTQKASGMWDYTYVNKMFEVIHVPDNTHYSLDGTVGISRSYTVRELQGQGGTVYWTGNSNISETLSNSPSYGASLNVVAPALSGTYPDGLVFTAKSPNLRVRGSSSYYKESFWNATEDIRYQYVIELWRAKKGNLNIDGWGVAQEIRLIFGCASSSTHTLT